MGKRYRWPFIRSANNYDMDKASDAAGLACPEPTRTQQHFKEETDINTLLRRFKVTGHLPQGARAPTFADFDEIYDFHSATQALAEARDAFMQIPAEIRLERFANDPARFVAFCSKDENRDEMKKLGFLRDEIPLNTATPPPGGATGATAGGGSTPPSQKTNGTPSGDSSASNGATA